MKKQPSAQLRYGPRWRPPPPPVDPVEQWRKANLGLFLPNPRHVCTKRCRFQVISFGQTVVCTATGSVHECGGKCDHQRIDRVEGDVFCDLTGVVLEQSKPTEGLYGDYQYNENYVPAGRELAADNVLDRYRDIDGRHLNKPEASSAGHFAHAMVYVSSMLSSDRFTQKDPVHSAEPRLEAILRRYMARTPWPDLIAMQQIAAEFVLRHEPEVVVSLPYELIGEMSRLYARTAVVAYALLRQYVPGGRELAGRFREFVVCALGMCQTGLAIRDRRDSYDIDFIPKDPLLSLLPVSTSDLREIVGTTRLAVPLAKDIRRAIQAAVNRGLSPELFRTADIPLDSLPDEAFD
jgi:hypothetical protein